MLRLATPAMGTRFEIILGGGDEHRLRAAGEEAFAIIHEWHARLNRFSKDSEIAFINRTAAARPVRLDADWLDLLRVCGDVRARSRGAFDPAVAPRMDRLRGDADGTGDRRGFEGIHIDEAAATMRFLAPGIALDLGGIAKGFALDRAAIALRECGIGCALLHGGTSSIVAIGAPPGRRGWSIVIESGAEPLHCTLCDAHLSVSATQGRRRSTGDAPRRHILDPQSGEPVAEDRTAAVLCGSGAWAEAWSTALCVLGERPAELGEEAASAIFDPSRGWDVAGAHSSCFDVPGARAAPVLEVA